MIALMIFCWISLNTGISSNDAPKVSGAVASASMISISKITSCTITLIFSASTTAPHTIKTAPKT